MVLGVITGCRSMQDRLVIAMEPCNGRISGNELVSLRDAAVGELLAEVTPPAGRIVITRVAAVEHPLLSSARHLVVEAVGRPLAEALLDQRREAECWPQGDFVLQAPSDSDPVEQDSWKDFRHANPAVIGILSVGTPAIVRSDRDQQVAAVLADFRCGDSCGGLWLIAFRRDAKKWAPVSMQGLLNY